MRQKAVAHYSEVDLGQPILEVLAGSGLPSMAVVLGALEGVSKWRFQTWADAPEPSLSGSNLRRRNDPAGFEVDRAPQRARSPPARQERSKAWTSRKKSISPSTP